MNRLLLAFALLIALGDGAQSTVTLDFIVTTPDAPLLTPADLSLKVGGRQQQIQSLQIIEKAASRDIVLLVDESTLFTYEPIVKSAVGKMLASLAAHDRVGFFSTRAGGAKVNLTTSREAITAAVDSIKTGPGVLVPCQRDLARVIRSFARDIPRGRSTSLVVISRGHPDGPAVHNDREAGPCSLQPEDLRQLQEAIATAQVNVHLFTVDEAQRAWGFENIAGVTGATSGLLTFARDDSLARTLESLPSFYRVTFAWSGPTDRAHRVELRTTRNGVKIRTSPVLRLQ